MHLFPLLLFLSLCHSIISCVAYHQSNYLLRHLLSTSSRSLSAAHDYISDPALFVAPQDGLMQADKITRLPGQPEHVDFDHYAGYVTVHAQPGRERALFYYFAESPTNSSSNPLVLWLNGGPGCSSFGYGAMEELGPFRVNSDGKTLYRNIFAWNNVANVIFLDSPAGVGFSYSKRENYEWGDAVSAKDAYTFLVNWVERFPQYKGRDFYITGESYAGHYVPQLAHIIFINNNTPNQTHFINLKGIAMGNALVDDKTFVRGFYDHVWTHALISDETHQQIFRTCDFVNNISSDECITYVNKSFGELGKINDYNIYAPLCTKPVLINATASLDFFDPCSDTYVKHYLNTAEVQRALHVNPTTWDFCRVYNWTDWQSNVLPTIQNLMARGLRVWLYSGDMDANVPITSTRYAINSLNLPIEKAWRPWYLKNEVGGYVEVYKGGLTLATVRGAGHAVPSYQPERALAIISSFIQGVLPPS